MPDPLLYLKAMGAAAIASITLLLAIAALRRSTVTTRANSSAVIIALAGGLLAGFYVFLGRFVWPPQNGLDRFLTIVLPAALVIEWTAGLRGLRQLAWPLRALLAMAMPRILLHGSVYLGSESSVANIWTLTILCGPLILGLWGLLSWLSIRTNRTNPRPYSTEISIPLSLNSSMLSAGFCVMMAGYLKGGAAAFPLAAALIATTIAIRILESNSLGLDKSVREHVDNPPGALNAPRLGESAIFGVSVVGLTGLLLIGRFFGELSTAQALVLLLSPLLCWTTELPRVREQPPWIVGPLRLFLVSLPLLALLVLAKRDFDSEMRPLMQIECTLKRNTA